MRISVYIAFTFICAASFGARFASAQDQSNPAPPIPAYHSPLIGGTDDSDAGDDNSNQSAVQYQALAGVQNLTLGEEPARSYWQPHADVFGTADSNIQESGHGIDWTTWISGTAGVDIHRTSGISNLMLSYAGGGMYSHGNNSLGNGVTQALSFSDRVSFRRSIFSVFDQASYLPQSSLGFGGLGVQLPGVGVSTTTGLAFNPGQSALTGWGQTLNNSTAVELDELLSRRSSLSFSGGYSLLHYFNSGLFNYGTINARAGYNYQLSQRNTFAVSYTFGDFRYASLGESFSDHTVQASFGRVINGKLSFQIAAGPETVLTSFSGGTLSGSGTGSATSTNVSQTELLWSLSTALQYQERRYGLNLAYNHGVSGGSGVVVGGQTDVVTGGVTRRMSRTFSSGLTGGYSRTQGIPGSFVGANQRYDYWFGGVNLTQPIGETLGLTLGYQVQYQTSNAAACVGPTCGTSILVHMISVGLAWHERPLLF